MQCTNNQGEEAEQRILVLKNAVTGADRQVAQIKKTIASLNYVLKGKKINFFRTFLRRHKRKQTGFDKARKRLQDMVFGY